MVDDRDDLALAMLAAWMNVRPDQLPPENRAHLNATTMAAWKRVGEAAIAHVARGGNYSEVVEQLNRYAQPSDLVVGPNMMREAVGKAAEALTTAQAEIEALRARVAELEGALVGISNAGPELTAGQLRLAARIAVEHVATLGEQP